MVKIRGEIVCNDCFEPIQSADVPCPHCARYKQAKAAREAAWRKQYNSPAAIRARKAICDFAGVTVR